VITTKAGRPQAYPGQATGEREARRLALKDMALLPVWYCLNRVKTPTVKLSDQLFDEITRSAVERRVPKSEIVRERLVSKQGKESSLWERMEDLVITNDSLPNDLSSNKALLKNYGQNSGLH
jgi:hypothetical protein